MSSNEDREIKEWVKLTHSANGKTSITVTLQEGRHSAKWAEACFIDPKTWKVALDQARKKARAFLDFLQDEDVQP